MNHDLSPSLLNISEENRRAVCKLRRERSKRSEILPKAMFAEVAWDTMLLLMQHRQEGPLCATQIAGKLETSPDEADQSINYLEEQNLLWSVGQCRAHHSRRVELTWEGARAMMAYLRSIRRPDEESVAQHL
jgi:hypothetical protein